MYQHIKTHLDKPVELEQLYRRDPEAFPKAWFSAV